jgi:hypothetical protein
MCERLCTAVRLIILAPPDKSIAKLLNFSHFPTLFPFFSKEANRMGSKSGHTRLRSVPAKLKINELLGDS